MNRLKQDWKSTLKTVGTYSFYLAVIIELMLVILDKSEFLYPFEGWTFRVTFLLCFIKFLCAECTAVYTLKDNVAIASFLILGTISYQVTGRNDLLRIVLFLAACKGEDMIRCLKMVFWITLIGCTGIILLSITGIYGAAALTKDYGRGGVETRYILGMGHPNALQCMVWMLTSLSMYLYHTKWKWFHYLAVWLLNLLFFFLTDSKTSMAIVTAAIVLFFIADHLHVKWGKRLFSAANIAAVIGSIILSVFVAKDAMCLWDYFWGGPLTAKVKIYLLLNKVLTGRIHGLIETRNHEGIFGYLVLTFPTLITPTIFDMGWVRLFLLVWYYSGDCCCSLPASVAGILFIKRDKNVGNDIVLYLFSVYYCRGTHCFCIYWKKLSAFYCRNVFVENVE